MSETMKRHAAKVEQARLALNAVPWWRPIKRQNAGREYRWVLFAAACAEMDARMTAPDTQPAPASGEGEALLLACHACGARLDVEEMRDNLDYLDRQGTATDTSDQVEAARTEVLFAHRDLVWEQPASEIGGHLRAALRHLRAALRERDEAREKVRRVETQLAANQAESGGMFNAVTARQLRAALGGEQAGDGGREGK